MNKPIEKASFIDPKYTLSFAVRFAGIALAGFFLFGVALFMVLNRRLGVGYFEDITTLANLQEKLPLILLATGITQAIVLSFVLFVLSLFWAHSVAGPLVRFRKYLKMIAEAQPAEGIAFRKNDQLHHLAREFSHLEVSCKKRRDKLIAYFNEARRIIDEYESLSKDKVIENAELSNKLSALRKVYKAMNGVFEKKEAG